MQAVGASLGQRRTTFAATATAGVVDVHVVQMMAHRLFHVVGRDVRVFDDRDDFGGVSDHVMRMTVVVWVVCVFVAMVGRICRGRLRRRSLIGGGGIDLAAKFLDAVDESQTCRGNGRLVRWRRNVALGSRDRNQG